MVIIELLQWWYGRGYLHLLRLIRARLAGIARAFSVVTLLKTLFSPWRRIISYGSESLADRFRALLDNAISRLVGAMVRLLVLLTALLIGLVTAVVSVVAAVAWPLLPPLAVGLVIWGLV